MPATSTEGHSLEPFRSDAVGRISSVRLVLIEGNRTKADLMRHYCLHRWGFDVVACCHTATEGITSVGRLNPDLIFASLSPIESPVADFVKGLRAAAPLAKLVLFSTSCSDYLVHLLRKLDYHGVVYEPDETLVSLAQLIERVRQGHKAASPSIGRYQTQLRTAPNAFPKLLSERHEEVLVCIAHSMTDEEIGQQLGVSTKTALSHRQNIMKKLNIHTTPKLIRYCIDKGFNSVPPPMTATLS